MARAPLHVAVLGAGALGSVYGVRLAMRGRGRTTVTFVVRPQRVASDEPIAIESARKGLRETLDVPTRAAAVPAEADVVLIAVGTEDLDAIRERLVASEAPLVVLTPMLPREWDRVRAAFGARVLAAMPNVVAYADKRSGAVRYWLPPAPTRIDAPWPKGRAAADAGDHPVVRLAHALSEAGLRARIEHDVHATNAATTLCFIAIGMAVALTGSADALAEDDALASLVVRACTESKRLAARIGTAEPWSLMTPVLATPWAMRGWIGLLHRLSPEGLVYYEEHFGRKLLAQHRLMAREIVTLAGDRRLPHDAWAELARRLDAARAS